MTATVLYEDEAVTVIHRPGASPYTLVTFADLTARPDGVWFWGATPASRLDLDVIGFVAKAANWYPAASMARAAAALRGVGRTERIGYGYSMGGYAALKWGCLLSLGQALAIAPQSSIDPADLPDEPRFHSHFDPRAHAGMRISAADLPPWCAVLFDPHDVDDRPHRQALPQSVGLRHIATPFIGHWGVWLLTGTAALGLALDRVRVRDVSGLRAMLHARRWQSLVWCRQLGGAALGRGHAGWAGAMLDRAAFLGATSAMVAETVGFANLVRARRLRQTGRGAAAAEATRAGLAALPDDPALLDRAGHDLLHDDPDAAEILFQRAIVQAPDHASARFGLSHALMHRQNRPEAIRQAWRAATIAPDDAELTAWLGHLLLGGRQGAAAELPFRMALARNPGLRHAHLGLSHALGGRGQLWAALGVTRQGLQRWPGDPVLRRRHRQLWRLLILRPLQAAMRSWRPPIPPPAPAGLAGAAIRQAASLRANGCPIEAAALIRATGRPVTMP